MVWFPEPYSVRRTNMSKPGYNVLLTWYSELRTKYRELRSEIVLKNTQIRQQKVMLDSLKRELKKASGRLV